MSLTSFLRLRPISLARNILRSSWPLTSSLQAAATARSIASEPLFLPSATSSASLVNREDVIAAPALSITGAAWLNFWTQLVIEFMCRTRRFTQETTYHALCAVDPALYGFRNFNLDIL